jgi:hypothetical protein
MTWSEERKAELAARATDLGAELTSTVIIGSEAEILRGWNMPFTSKRIQETGGAIIYVWRGAFSPNDDAPVLVHPGGTPIERNGPWNFGVVRLDELPAGEPIEAFADAAQYSVQGDDTDSAIAKVLAQLALWVPPTYGDQIAS